MIVALICVVVAGLIYRSAFIALASFVLAVPLLRRVGSGALGMDLVPVLSGTGRFELVYGMLLAIGLAVSPGLG